MMTVLHGCKPVLSLLLQLELQLANDTVPLLDISGATLGPSRLLMQLGLEIADDLVAVGDVLWRSLGPNGPIFQFGPQLAEFSLKRGLPFVELINLSYAAGTTRYRLVEASLEERQQLRSSARKSQLIHETVVIRQL
jgi:hypothetical protein